MRSWPLLLVLAALPAFAGERESLELARWETARAPRDGAPGKFQASVPRLDFAAGQEDVVARCVFELPAALATLSLCLSLERVRWDAAVELDGKELARGQEGDLLLDLPLAAGKHELRVRARDLRAASAVLKRGADDDTEGAWRAPVGRAPRLAGILGAARIVERLPVDVRSVFVRDGKLAIEVRGRAGEPCDVGFVCSGAPRTARVALAPGEIGVASLEWPERPRWPERREVSILVAGKEERRVALAERRVAVEGGRLLVNGAPVFLALVEPPPGDAKQAIERARDLGANALSTAGFRDDAWFEAVEAAGLLVLVEADLARPASSNALDDERFWRALEREWREAVPRLRGRSCVVAWSLARGLLREGGAASPLVRTRLAALREVVRSLDPSRPVVLADDDGRALGFEIAWSAVPGPGLVAVLPPTDAPPSFAERLRLAGDPGFLDPRAVAALHERARGHALRAARAAGALGADLGASLREPELRAALSPVALVAEPVRGGGELAERPFKRRIVADASVAFAWTFTLGAATVATGRGHGAALDVEVTPPAVRERTRGVLAVAAPGGSLDVPVTVWPARFEPLATRAFLIEGPDGATGEALVAAGVPWREAPAFPETLERGSTLVVGEGALDENATRPRLLAFVERARRIGAGVVVLRQTTPYPEGLAPPVDGFDPRGARDLALREPLDRLVAGIEPGDLTGWPGTEGALPPPALERPVRADARVLVEGAPLGLADAVGVVSVEDAAWPELLCQVPLAARRDVPAARALLRALVREASAPRVSSERPFFARGDAETLALLESLALVPRPWSLQAIEAAPAPVILVDDEKVPLTDADRAALERAVAAGATLIVRLPDDPAIARLGSLAPAGLAVEKTKELPDPRLLAALHASDLLWPPAPGGFRDFTARFDSAPRSARAEDAVALVRPGALLEVPRGRGRLLLDLVRWKEAAKIPQARRWLAQLLSQLGAERHEPPIRLPVTSWNGIGREGDAVMFYSNGTASARFVAKRAGRYAVTVELGGTKARNGYPVARIVCDAKHLGDIELDGPGPKSYELEVTIPAGAHVLNVSFTNDVYEAPEDRNMTLRSGILRLLPPRVW